MTETPYKNSLIQWQEDPEDGVAEKPILINQPDPIKEQIERDVNSAYSYMAPGPRSHAVFGGIDSATAQDKIATNRTVEAAIAAIEPMLCSGAYTISDIIKELEKLRRV